MAPRAFLLGVSLILLVTDCGANVPKSAFFSYGGLAGDAKLAPGDDTLPSAITANQPVCIFGTVQTTMSVSINGQIRFRGVLNFDNEPRCTGRSGLIASIQAYGADVDTTNGGNIYYRQVTSDDTFFSKAATEIETAIPALTGTVQVTWAFVATWDSVPGFNVTPTLTNTFQAVVATDNANRTFVILYYDTIQWSFTPSTKYTRNHCASVGYDAADGRNSFFLNEACGEDENALMTALTTTGKYVYRIDAAGTGNATGCMPTTTSTTTPPTTASTVNTTINTASTTQSGGVTTSSPGTGNSTASAKKIWFLASFLGRLFQG